MKLKGRKTFVKPVKNSVKSEINGRIVFVDNSAF